MTPHLICAGAAEAIEFYQKAFGAVELSRMPDSDGKVMHASIRIGDSTIMLNDEMPDVGHIRSEIAQGFTGHHSSLRRERGRRLRAGGARRCEGHDAARRHVLGRSLWQAGRSFRPSMVDRHARPGCQSRRRCKRRWRRWVPEFPMKLLTISLLAAVVTASAEPNWNPAEAAQEAERDIRGGKSSSIGPAQLPFNR